MSDISIRIATKNDAAAVAEMLAGLADDLGHSEHFHSTAKDIIKFGFGDKPMFECLIAATGKADLGLALFFPIFSTNRAKPGIYVQDLWISEQARGQGLGKRLLAEVIQYGADKWEAAYLSLVVYADNANAMDFYKKLGFENFDSDVPMSLDGKAFARLQKR